MLLFLQKKLKIMNFFYVENRVLTVAFFDQTAKLLKFISKLTSQFFSKNNCIEILRLKRVEFYTNIRKVDRI